MGFGGVSECTTISMYHLDLWVSQLTVAVGRGGGGAFSFTNALQSCVCTIQSSGWASTGQVFWLVKKEEERDGSGDMCCAELSIYHLNPMNYDEYIDMCSCQTRACFGSGFI